ncbi:MAG: cyclic nucleotide-binding domain-containing protein [Opitutus sp.]
MTKILQLLHACEKRHFASGAMIVEQGKTGGQLFFLIHGTVEVLKDGVQVATTSQPAAAFGEMSVLLGGPHTASVHALKPCDFYVVDHPRAFLESSPPVCLHVCELIARRLDSMNRYLVDVQHQLAGDDHYDLVDGVLATLLHRQPKTRTRPSDSTISHGQVSD